MEDLTKFYQAPIYWDSLGKLKHSKLLVSVVSGHGLLSADSNGKSDPFVTIQLKEPEGGKKAFQKAKTQVIDKTLNPKWDFKTKFSLRPTSNVHSPGLLFEVFDWDRLSTNDPLGHVVLPWADVLVEHSGMKKHTLTLNEPKKRPNPGTIVIETQIKSQVLMFLAYLRKNPDSNISDRCAKSLAEALPYAPAKVTTSQLPVWVVKQFFAKKCYSHEHAKLWKDYAFSILAPGHPYGREYVGMLGSDARVLLEANLAYQENEFDNGRVARDAALEASVQEAWNSWNAGNFHEAVFLVTRAAVAGIGSAQHLLALGFEKLFPNEEHLASSWWAKAAENNVPEAVAKSKEIFARHMEQAQQALRAIKVPSDLDKVLEHLKEAEKFTHDPGFGLICSVFYPTDDIVSVYLHKAAVRGCTDAARLVEHFQKHQSWNEVKEKVPEYSRVLNHIADSLKTSNWLEFVYHNILN